MAVRYAALSVCQKVRMPSVRAEKYIRDASGWRKDVTDGNDNGTDGQTDRQTDRQGGGPHNNFKIFWVDNIMEW